jgi:hypothetical protein
VWDTILEHVSSDNVVASMVQNVDPAVQHTANLNESGLIVAQFMPTALPSQYIVPPYYQTSGLVETNNPRERAQHGSPCYHVADVGVDCNPTYQSEISGSNPLTVPMCNSWRQRVDRALNTYETKVAELERTLADEHKEADSATVKACRIFQVHEMDSIMCQLTPHSH